MKGTAFRPLKVKNPCHFYGRHRIFLTMHF